VEITCRVYRPRDPRKTPLYGLLESLYEKGKGAWEERFEQLRLLARSRGRDRGELPRVRSLARRLRKGSLPEVSRRVPGRLLCKRRGVCPSCGAKRAVVLAAFLQDEVVEPVGHAQWGFTAAVRG